MQKVGQSRFFALILERHLEILLSEFAIDYSAEKIREAIMSLQASKVEIDNEGFYICSKISILAENILKILKLKPPLNITKEEYFAYAS